MKIKISERVYAVVGGIEVLIGFGTLLYLAFVEFFSPEWAPAKPVSIAVFVGVTAVISFVLGIGLLKHKEWARIMLIFFSGYIMIEKGLMFAGILHFSGEVVSGSALAVKDMVSFFYHLFVLIALCLYKKRSIEI